jgi:hypothetical protein
MERADPGPWQEGLDCPHMGHPRQVPPDLQVVPLREPRNWLKRAGRILYTERNPREARRNHTRSIHG